MKAQLFPLSLSNGDFGFEEVIGGFFIVGWLIVLYIFYIIIEGWWLNWLINIILVTLSWV